MGSDPAVSTVALAIDLVEEYDGDTSYLDAALDVAGDMPVVVLTNLASAVDLPGAARLRAAGVPVLEGTRSGLVALKHLLALAAPRPPAGGVGIDVGRQQRWATRLADPQPLDGAESLALLADYGLATPAVRRAATEGDAVKAADELGYPVVLKTDQTAIAHRSDVGGVVVGLGDGAAVRDAYRDLARRLGPQVLVNATAPAGVELALGLVNDPQLGPLVVIAAGGVLAELLTDRVVALPPVSPQRAENLLLQLRIRRLLDGWRGAAAVDVQAVVTAIVSLGVLAVELGDRIAALDVNPLIVGPQGAIAVDALMVRSTDRAITSR
jgi:acyl-CoA synthetase (NDP forming)